MQHHLIPIEEWRPIPGYETFYSVSNHGQVRRDAPSIKQGGRSFAGKILSASMRVGYQRVSLYDRETKSLRSINVHQLVALAFLGPPPDGMEINHIDHNRANPALWNLEYVTRSENVLHGFRFGRKAGGPPGILNGHARLTEEQVREIRNAPPFSKRGDSLPKRYGVSATTIWKIRTGRKWKHLTTE